jgi:hypothetical protein
MYSFPAQQWAALPHCPSCWDSRVSRVQLLLAVQVHVILEHLVLHPSR